MLVETVLRHHGRGEIDSVKGQSSRLHPGVRESNSYGRAQHVLLEAFPAGVLSGVAANRLREWRRKFRDPEVRRREMDARGYSVVSSIRRGDLHSMSDDAWLRLMKGPVRGRNVWKQREHGPELVGESSTQAFQDDFHEAARSNPRRFAELGLRIPAGAHPGWLTRLFHALSQDARPAGVDADAAVSGDLLNALVVKTGAPSDDDRARSLGWLIQKRRDVSWSREVVEILRTLTRHPDPAPDENRFVASTPASGGREVPDPFGSALNSARGGAVTALQAVMARQPEHIEIVLPEVRALLHDPHVGVRHLAMGLCGPIHARLPDLAIDLALDACLAAPDDALAGLDVKVLATGADAGRRERLGPVLDRMLAAQRDDVAQAGAAAIAWLHFEHGGRAAEFAACCTGRAALRAGVTDIVERRVSKGTASAAEEALLREAMDDEDLEVRKVTARLVGRDEMWKRPEMPGLAEAFVASKAFLDHRDFFLLHMSRNIKARLLEYREVILRAIDALCTCNVEEQRRGIVAIDELSRMLLGLYQAARGTDDEPLMNSCLDRWDALLRSDLGRARAQLKVLDE
jgi:hypothetical protein